MPRGVKRECYWGWCSNIENECRGRRRLLWFDCENEKKWICKLCYDFLCDEWYCDSGLQYCSETCGKHCREEK